MPNWNLAQSVIYSEKKGTIEDLSEKLDKILKSETRTPGKWDDSPKWTGNVLISLGLNEKDVLEDKYTYLRSEISYTEKNIKKVEYKGKTLYYFRINLLTAYCCYADTWQHILEELYPQDKTIGISYIAEIPGSMTIERKEARLVEILFGLPKKATYVVSVLNKENFSDYLEEIMSPEETLFIVKDRLNKEYPLEYFKDINEFMKIRKEISEQKGKYFVDIEPIYTWDTI